MREHTFHTPEPIELLVEIGRGGVRVHAVDTSTTHVEVTGSRADDVQVEHHDGQVSVVAHRQRLGGEPDVEVSVTLPTGSRLVTRLGSADLVVTGTIGAARLKTGSGDVTLETVAGPTVVQTGSGDISLDRSEDNLKVQTGSGDVTLGTTAAAVSVSTGSGDVAITATDGPAVVKTGSGDLVITRASADASFTTASGDLRVHEASRGRVSARTASGEVAIGVRSGVPVWTDLRTVTGRIHSSLQGAGQPEPGQDHLELRTTTVTGDIVLTEV